MNEEKRKRLIRGYIGEKLKGMLRAAKKGMWGVVHMDYDEILGMVSYMLLVDDISEEQYTRILKLASIIKRRCYK